AADHPPPRPPPRAAARARARALRVLRRPAHGARRGARLAAVRRVPLRGGAAVSDEVAHVTGAEHDAMAIARAIYDVPEERRLDALAFALRMAIEGGWLERVSPPRLPPSSPTCETTTSETSMTIACGESCTNSTGTRPHGGGSRG